MKNVLDGLLETIKKLTKRVERLETQQHKHPIWNLGTPTELTIAGGIITRTRSNHTVDTQADAATDDLDTISGGVEGDTGQQVPHDGCDGRTAAGHERGRERGRGLRAGVRRRELPREQHVILGEGR